MSNILLNNNSSSNRDETTTITDAIYTKIEKPSSPTIVSRSQLPSRSTGKSVSIWSILKKSIGKDLSRITFPVVFNEPLSLLQRLAEYMEYVSLIKDAAKAKDPIERMEYVAAFALSALGTNSTRLSKPFNPLLYETYELSKPEHGFEFIAEQVSHHPAISAFYAKGEDFEFYGSVEPNLKFWARSLEVFPQSNFTLLLKPFNETYTWEGLPCSIHNLYMGKMYMAFNGILNIQCQGSNLHTDIRFHNKNGDDTILYGEILQGNNSVRVLYGDWTEYIASTSVAVYQQLKDQWKKECKIYEKKTNSDMIIMFPESHLLWRVHKKPPNSKDYWNMTYFSMMLNEELSDASLKLPPTDVRFRPDVRLLELGLDTDVVSNEKERMEEKQRARAKARGSGAVEPRWFKKDENGFYTFNKAYWMRDFTNSENIF